MSDHLEAFAGALRALLAQYDPDRRSLLFHEHTATLSASVREQLGVLVFGDGSQIGDVTVRDVVGGDLTKARISVREGQAVAPIAVNHGHVNVIVNGDAIETKSRITYYLDTLLESHDWLRLNRLLGKELNGTEESSIPAMPLRSVYTRLTTSSWVAGAPFTLSQREVLQRMDRGNPSQVLPDEVAIPAVGSADSELDIAFRQRYALDAQGMAFGDIWARVRRDVDQEQKGVLSGHWYNLESPLQALLSARRVVLLGAPGSGKSTVLRYIVVNAAESLLRGQPISADTPLPYFCPLGRVAQELTDNPREDLEVLINCMLRPMAGVGVLTDEIRHEVRPFLHAGSVLLCFDGLDEVSGTVKRSRSGQRSLRQRLADAIQRLAEALPRAVIMVTCRTKPYQQAAAWQLRDGWTTRTIAPMSFGQVRHFVKTWYVQAGQRSKFYSIAQAEQRAIRLSKALESRPKLQEVTTSPLLLTMLALLDYNNKQLPEKRVDVYEELVKLLLDRWETLRSDGQRPRETISERLELPHLTGEQIRRVVHELAYEAHRGAVDGRGVISGERLRAHLDDFFARQIDPENPRRVSREEKVRRSALFEQLLRDETGLIQEEDDETYVLPHLTFEEYLCACHLASSEQPYLVYKHWSESSDRWREVILLLMGRLLHQEKYLMAAAWLQTLIDRHVPQEPHSTIKRPKSLEQRQRDALFASTCYIELGRQASLGGRVPAIDVLEQHLRDALIDTIQHPSPALLLDQRIDVARELVTLGDSRFPVTTEAWRLSVMHRPAQLSGAKTVRAQQSGTTESYWCAVPRGAYQIGGWSSGETAVMVKLNGFWIARFPVTVSQFAAFVEVGYGGDTDWCWSEAGLAWRNRHEPTEPWNWRRPPFDVDTQPVVGVNWYEATAYARWLTDLLADDLPQGYELRLPTEAEWEAAAVVGHEHRPNAPWGSEPSDVDRAIYEASLLGQPAPVGCCPRGKAPCGAQDMLGNVWELTMSSYRGYPSRSAQVMGDIVHDACDIAWRGGTWDTPAAQLSIGARERNYVHIVHGVGFRLVLAPAP